MAIRGAVGTYFAYEVTKRILTFRALGVAISAYLDCPEQYNKFMKLTGLDEEFAE